MSSQTPFSPPTLPLPVIPADDLNAAPRCPVILILDTSASMTGAPIAELNAGVAQLRDELADDKLARARVEVAIVSCGGTATLVQDFQTALTWTPSPLTAQGQTPLGAAIDLALDTVRTRKDWIRNNSLGLYRPWLFIISDGAPTDDWAGPAERLRSEVARKGLAAFVVGVNEADLDILGRIAAPAMPLKLKGLQFRELFKWLSNSLSKVSQSRPGTSAGGDPEPVKLDNPASPTGWAQV